MGGSSSTVKSDAIDKEDDSVITVSEAVARRLLGKEDINRKSDLPSTPAEQPKQQQPDAVKSKLPTAKEDKLQMLEAYQDRIKVLEQHNTGLQEISKENFDQAVRDVENKYMKYGQRSPICTDLQEAVRQCYLENPSTTLNCAPQVRAFKNCVESHHKASLSHRG